jgi:CspA family cold shock protein
LGLAPKPPRLEPSSTVTFGLGAPGTLASSVQIDRKRSPDAGGGFVVASGTVRWFNDENGYGFIAADEGGADLFVHRGSIVGNDWRTRTLVEGARVGFDRCEGGMCPEAIHVLKLAATGSP